jgi:hypothetical protein
MTRTILIATVVVGIAAIAYLTVVGTSDPVQPVAENRIGTPAANDADAVVEENISNRVGSDAATDEAFESALEGEEPVQPNLDTSIEAATLSGAVGAAPEFTPEGYDRDAVVTAIEQSDLDAAEKDELVARLAEAEPAEPELSLALAEIREALARVQ